MNATLLSQHVRACAQHISPASVARIRMKLAGIAVENEAFDPDYGPPVTI